MEMASLEELFEKKCAELEKTQMQVLHTRKLIESAKTLLDLTNWGSHLQKVPLSSFLSDIFVPTQTVVEQSCTRLVSEKGLELSNEERNYLEEEIQESDPETTLAWISSLKRTRQAAHPLKVPLQFVRGAGPGGMLPFLCGWTHANPVPAGLNPPVPGAHWKDIHFDVPFSCPSEFFEAVITLNAEQSQFKFTPFRLPLLDILAKFFKSDVLLEVETHSDHAVLAQLQSGNIAGISC